MSTQSRREFIRRTLCVPPVLAAASWTLPSVASAPQPAAVAIEPQRSIARWKCDET